MELVVGGVEGGLGGVGDGVGGRCGGVGMEGSWSGFHVGGMEAVDVGKMDGKSESRRLLFKVLARIGGMEQWMLAGRRVCGSLGVGDTT